MPVNVAPSKIRFWVHGFMFHWHVTVIEVPRLKMPIEFMHQFGFYLIKIGEYVLSTMRGMMPEFSSSVRNP